MAPSTVYTRASTSINASSCPSVLRTLASSNIKRNRVASVRNLWWWSRHGTWSSTNDENIEERLQRHQKIMRQRYSRALRRRAMWDRDDNVSAWFKGVSDGRLDRKWGAWRPISSTDPLKARFADKQDPISDQEDFWAKTKHDFKKLDQDFEAFKAAVDRSIERDPYGTLFGRQLQSPPSENNSSWISWLFNKGDPMLRPADGSVKSSNFKKIEIEVLDKEAPSVKSHGASSAKAGNVAPVQRPLATQTDYIYDPISGRKVPKPITQPKAPEQPKRSFLETLFTENGSSPDKPVKQQRVFGHTSGPPKACVNSEVNTDQQPPKTAKGFANSRVHEFQKLRASMIGNNIDTTAEFGGKYETDPIADIDEAIRKTRKMSQHEDTVQLFSGTTYEPKASLILASPESHDVSWLQKEGFQSREMDTDNVAASKPPGRLQSSFDRMQQKTEAALQQKLITKLQPAIERMQDLKPREVVKVMPRMLNVTSTTPAQPERSLIINQQPVLEEKQEDVDLLRASDVRAATRAARITKQEVIQAKVEMRSQLEYEFDRIQKQKSDEIVPDTKQLRAGSSKLSRVVDHGEHAETHHKGIVSNTMGPMGLAFKDYQKPYNPNRVDLTQRLEFDVDSLEQIPFIYNKKAQGPIRTDVEVPQGVRDEQQAGEDLTESHRSSTRQIKDNKEKEDAQVERLAKDIHHVYAAEHGPMDLSFNSNALPKADPREQTLTAKTESSLSSEDPLNYALAKESFLSAVNQVAKDVKDVKAQTLTLESDMKEQVITPSQASTMVLNLTAQATSHLQKVNSLHQNFDEHQKVLHPLSTAAVKPGVPRYPATENYTQVFEPQYVQLLNGVKSVRKNLQNLGANLHDLKRSRLIQTEKRQNNVEESAQPQKVVRKEDAPTVLQAENLSSPYLILVYNKTTGDVDQTAMDRLPWSSSEKIEKANAIRIMGNLNYPAAFVTRFVNLERAGYELSSGGGDMLIFQKTTTPVQGMFKPSGQITAVPQAIRNAIAAEEASSQPEISETIAQPKNTTSKRTATVLDNIPVEIPNPGPAAPTAPPATSSLGKLPKAGPKVRRQEHVFSGTIPIRSAPKSSQQSKQETKKGSQQDSDEHDATFFTRTTRTLKRSVLGVAAFGAAAYSIGVVAEGIGAQAQVEGDATAGPRRKMVMPIGQRPGIYSTESSRID